MAASRDECRAFHDLLAEHALKLLAPEEASAVVPHLASCTACRDEHDCLAAVAAHLSPLRDALSGDSGRLRQRPHLPGPTGSRPASPRRHRRRGPAGSAWTASLTLSQWVARMAYVR